MILNVFFNSILTIVRKNREPKEISEISLNTPGPKALKDLKDLKAPIHHLSLPPLKKSPSQEGDLGGG